MAFAVTSFAHNSNAGRLHAAYCESTVLLLKGLFYFYIICCMQVIRISLSILQSVSEYDQSGHSAAVEAEHEGATLQKPQTGL